MKLANERKRKNPMELEELLKSKSFSKPKKPVLIICLLLLTCYLYQIKPVSSKTIQVTPGQKIQTAINNAAAGDTIQVAAGIYYEHVFVNKSLTIIGENPQTTIVDGTANGTVFNLDASNIYLSGFTIRNAGNNYNAITSENIAATSDYDQITNNIIKTSSYGISLSLSNFNKILNNKFLDNSFGNIFASNAGNTNITGNTITGSVYGIRMITSTNNIIVGNNISQSSYSVHLTSSSTGNTIRKNTILAKNTGIYSSSDSAIIDHNTILEGAYGIYLYNCKSGSIYYNVIRNNSSGIRLYSTTGSNTVNNNKIQYDDWGIELVSSSGNTFTGNWLLQNAYGIFLASSSSNIIYHNNFVNNSMQAYSPTANTWDNGYPSGGNYWSDYTGVDVKSGPNQDQPGSDGIGDTSYTPYSGNIDHYPLMDKWSEHDVSIESVTPSTNQPNEGSIVDISVTVKNKGKISPAVSETFTVTAKYNSSIIETQTVSNLAQGATQTLTFHWNTAGAIGKYTISAQASTVPDELNTDNNNFIDGTVTVQVRDVAVTSIRLSKTTAYTGYENINIEVDVKNEGTIIETFEVVAYYNSNPIGAQTITLSSGATTTLTFTWNTLGVTPGSYTISATAGTVPDETHLSDNTLTDGTVRLKIPGDIDGNGKVDIVDYSLVSAHWYPGPPIGPLGYDSNADINNDGAINILEMAIISANWSL